MIGSDLWVFRSCFSTWWSCIINISTDQSWPLIIGSWKERRDSSCEKLRSKGTLLPFCTKSNVNVIETKRDWQCAAECGWNGVVWARNAFFGLLVRRPSRRPRRRSNYSQRLPLLGTSRPFCWAPIDRSMDANTAQDRCLRDSHCGAQSAVRFRSEN